MPPHRTGIDRGIGGHHGTSRQAPFDRWFRYPAGLSAEALTLLLSPERNPDGGLVLDPFCGSATVGTAALFRSWPFVGIEAHPELAELADLKLRPLAQSPTELLSLSREVATRQSVRAASVEEPALLARCFSQPVLATLQVLREGVRRAPEWARPYLKWALLATLRDVANVRVGWPYLRPNIGRRPPYTNPEARFLVRLRWMVEDLCRRPNGISARVRHGDATLSDSWTDAEGPASLCITSPPYLNNFDYADATRLEVFFWGRNTTWSDMCADVRAKMLVATTQQASVAGARKARETMSAQWPAVADRLEPCINELKAAGASRTRGKEYDRVLPEYFVGLLHVLEQLRQRLAPGSWCGWVVGDSAPYGVYIDTPQLILLAATTVGFEARESVVLRPRGLRWKTNGTRHQVALEERLIWFRAQ